MPKRETVNYDLSGSEDEKYTPDTTSKTKSPEEEVQATEAESD